MHMIKYTATLSKLNRLYRRTFTIVVLAALLVSCGDGDSANSASDSGDTTGTGGSTARMTIIGDYLYAIAGSDVQLFRITDASNPSLWLNVRLDWNIETLFPYGDYLLVGAADALHILDNTDPGNPSTVTTFPHAMANDPVVAADNHAYVTLSSDNLTNFNSPNELRIVDITNLTNPILIDTKRMQKPTGLAIDNDQLFVCDGRAGIKIFDVSNPSDAKITDFIPDVNCKDVIAKDNTLYAITENNLLQYDYGTLPPRLVSSINKGS